MEPPGRELIPQSTGSFTFYSLTDEETQTYLAALYRLWGPVLRLARCLGLLLKET